MKRRESYFLVLFRWTSHHASNLKEANQVVEFLFRKLRRFGVKKKEFEIIEIIKTTQIKKRKK